ncbi:5-(aminomethyl)-3-furanmethanol phosphate kinase [uncultured archaeon]|nr:5-(aminomethyl)-3-furanmethanol phosphate kinase [uncultured archaeon]
MNPQGLNRTEVEKHFGKGRLFAYPSQPYIQSAFGFFLLTHNEPEILAEECRSNMSLYVLKLGGSLLPVARNLIGALFSLAEEGYSFLVVPGGGPMADLIRELFARHRISEEAAHWMAILAMEQYAYFLADGTCAELSREIRPPSAGNCVAILLPYQTLLQDDAGIEHSWDYTSDAVALIAALGLKAQLIKATNVDGIFLGGKVSEEVPASTLLGMESCVDQGTLRLLVNSPEDASIWVLNGSDPERFISALKEARGGTVIRCR